MQTCIKAGGSDVQERTEQLDPQTEILIAVGIEPKDEHIGIEKDAHRSLPFLQILTDPCPSTPLGS